MSQTVFDGVLYYISETLPLDKRNELSEVLDARGGTPVSVSNPNLTHFITSSLALEDFVESLPEGSPAYVVTPRWVERSAILGSAQDPEYYNPDPAYLFSGVTAAATDLSQSDCELMSAAITALGGQWRSAFTRDVTHLFALAPGSAKYETAMHYREELGVRVLVPHWFDDTVRLGIRELPTRNYEWPEPRVFQQRPEGRSTQEDVEYEPPAERMMLYETASLSNDEQKQVKPASRNVWKGKSLLLGLSLDLSDNQRKALHADIRRQGGEVVELSSSKSLDEAERIREELSKLDAADVFVTRYRTGAAYAKAYQQKKTIGTLAWLWYVRASGTLTRPADQLLHYPIPDRPADGFGKEIVTVTNYTGKDREYLKKLITLMGGQFTASMSAEQNTIVVAAYLHGTKTDKATSWSIPIVNHTWVEDCFVQWRRLTPAREKYIVFPPGVDFSTVLAERGVGKITWEPGQLEEMQRVVEEASTPKKPRKSKSKSDGASVSPKKAAAEAKKAKAKAKPTKKAAALPESDTEEEEDEEEGQPPPATAESAGEVEEAVAVDEEGELSEGGRMDVDVEMPATAAMDIDEPGPSTKKGPPSKRAKAAATDAPAPKRKLVRRYTTLKTDDEGEEPVATPARDGVTTPSPKRPARTYGSSGKARRKRADREESPSPVKKSVRKLAVDEDVEMADESSEEEEPRGKTNGKAQAKGSARTTTKAKEQPTEGKKLKVIEPPSESDSNSSDEDPRSVLSDLLQNRKGKARAPAAAAAPAKGGMAKTTQRLDSVVVPTVSSVYTSPTKRVGNTDSPIKVGPPKKAKKSAAAATPVTEQSDAPHGKSKKARPSTPPPPKTTRKAAANANAEAGPSRASASTSPSKLTRTPSKRSAATKAAQKLHTEIMPDMNSFQKEMKSGTVRAAYEREQPELLRSASKGKTPAGPKGKKRPSMDEAEVDDDEEEDEEERMPEKKRRKTSDGDKGRGKKKGREAADSEEPEDAVPSKKGASASANGVVAADAKNVRILTTQLTLADDVKQALVKLGAKHVTKPSECTHLLVRSVVRTEKFLCAMAVAPHVLSEKWAISSVAQKKLLPEAKFAIKDEETERKYNFVLAEALERAKQNKGKLFKGVTFYVTPKVPVESKLLRNVVAANGGQFLTQTPTVRILAGQNNRFVISCPEDVSIWRPLAQHHRIYTQELILTSALKQEVDWENEAFQVAGSF